MGPDEARHESHQEKGSRDDRDRNAHRLLDLYWEQFAEEQVALEEFCRRVADGELGAFAPDDLRAFLEAVETNILSNIQTMVEVNPHLEALRDERAAETQEMIADLIARYVTGSPDNDNDGRRG